MKNIIAKINGLMRKSSGESADMISKLTGKIVRLKETSCDKLVAYNQPMFDVDFQTEYYVVKTEVNSCKGGICFFLLTSEELELLHKNTIYSSNSPENDGYMRDFAFEMDKSLVQSLLSEISSLQRNSVFAGSPSLFSLKGIQVNAFIKEEAKSICEIESCDYNQLVASETSFFIDGTERLEPRFFWVFPERYMND